MWVHYKAHYPTTLPFYVGASPRHTTPLICALPALTDGALCVLPTSTSVVHLLRGVRIYSNVLPPSKTYYPSHLTVRNVYYPLLTVVH